MSSPGYRCCARIDSGALERNLGRIRSSLPKGIRYISVVKADAYGHGAGPMTTRLMQSAADAFAVANVEEGARIRALGKGWPVLVLGSALPEEMDGLFDCGLTATLSSEAEAELLESKASKRNTKLKVHLKVDTGMGRLGVWYEEALGLMERVAASQHLELDGLYTHFSCADSDEAFTRLQRSRFLDVLSRCPIPTENMWVHADNSAGLETFAPGGPFNAVRIGLLQFGCPPARGSLLESIKVDPVLTFEARVVLLKRLPEGAALSYGATHVLGGDATIAVLAAGYGDGVPTALSNKGEVLIKGQRAPILGRVTMDQTLIDVSGIDGVEVGDTAVFFGATKGDAISVMEFAEKSDSIPWESFCSITKRVPRIYTAERSV